MTRSPDDPITRWQERERAFLIGAPLVIVPALVFLPAVMFLIVFPQVRHGRAIGLMVVPACALAILSRVCPGLSKYLISILSSVWMRPRFGMYRSSWPRP